MGETVTSLPNNKINPAVAADFVNLVNSINQEEERPLNYITKGDKTNMYYNMTYSFCHIYG
jgi:hypothetical protein